jgi:hypothetical protein
MVSVTNNTIMFNVIMLSDIMLSVRNNTIMLLVIMLSVIMLSVIMLNVVMLNVVAPSKTSYSIMTTILKCITFFLFFQLLACVWIIKLTLPEIP